LRISMPDLDRLNPNTFSVFKLILVLFCLGLPISPVAGSNDRPNIIFIFSDDQRFDALGFLHPILETPNIDRLAEQGVHFPNAFVTTPICASSRATVLTGLHEQRHGFTFRTPPLNMKLLQESYPKLLRDNGYTTGFVGKNGMGLDKERIELLFDYYVPVNRNPYIQIRDGEEIHATDYTARKAVEFIRNTSSPFVLSVWFNAPHAEDSDPAQFIPPQRYSSLYSGIDFPDPPTSDPGFFLKQPEFLQDSLNRVRWSWRWTPQLYDSMMSGYLAMIKGVDDAIGEILEQTVTSGVADRTVVIFMSDNGYFIGERGFAGKWLAYEPSIRVPLLIYDPRLDSDQQGRVLTQTALNIDLPETILELAGIEIPESMQGRSLVPLLNGDNPDWRNEFFIEHFFTYPPEVVIPPHEG
jgi:arylsulfatase A-like enzyme